MTGHFYLFRYMVEFCYFGFTTTDIEKHLQSIVKKNELDLKYSTDKLFCRVMEEEAGISLRLTLDHEWESFKRHDGSYIVSDAQLRSIHDEIINHAESPTWVPALKIQKGPYGYHIKMMGFHPRSAKKW